MTLCVRQQAAPPAPLFAMVVCAGCCPTAQNPPALPRLPAPGTCLPWATQPWLGCWTCGRVAVPSSGCTPLPTGAPSVSTWLLPCCRCTPAGRAAPFCECADTPCCVPEDRALHTQPVCQHTLLSACSAARGWGWEHLVGAAGTLLNFWTLVSLVSDTHKAYSQVSDRPAMMPARALGRGVPQCGLAGPSRWPRCM